MAGRSAAPSAAACCDGRCRRRRAFSLRHQGPSEGIEPAESAEELPRLLRVALRLSEEGELDADLRTVGTVRFDLDAVYVHEMASAVAA